MRIYRETIDLNLLHPTGNHCSELSALSRLHTVPIALLTAHGNRTYVKVHNSGIPVSPTSVVPGSGLYYGKARSFLRVRGAWMTGWFLLAPGILSLPLVLLFINILLLDSLICLSLYLHGAMCPVYYIVTQMYGTVLLVSPEVHNCF